MSFSCPSKDEKSKRGQAVIVLCKQELLAFNLEEPK